MSVYLWNDVSPDDGCTLVRFSMSATSLHEVVAAIRGVAGLQNTTTGHLLRRGSARKARPEEAETALVLVLLVVLFAPVTLWMALPHRQTWAELR